VRKLLALLVAVGLVTAIGCGPAKPTTATIKGGGVTPKPGAADKDKMGEKPGDKPGDKPEDKPGGKPEDKPTDKPGGKPEDKTPPKL